MANYIISGGGTIMEFFNGTTTVTEADVHSYSGYLGLTTIIMPSSIVLIDSSACANLPTLTTVTFLSPSSLQTIGSYVFSQCTALTTLTLPPVLQTIGTGSFQDVSFNAPLIIPSSVQTIGNGAFQNATLNTLTFSDGLRSIGASAFQNVQFVPVATLTIPPTVLTIGSLAFAQSNLSLAQVTYTSTTAIQGDTFPSYTTLIVLQGPDPPTSLIAIPGISSITLSWTPPVQTGLGPVLYYVITDTNSLTTYQSYDVSYTFLGLTTGVTYTYTLQTVNTELATSAPSLSISSTPKILVVITFSGLLDQRTNGVDPCQPLTVSCVPFVPSLVGPLYNGLTVLPSLPGGYTVSAYIPLDDPLYTGFASTTLSLTPFLPIYANCSPALELNALSKGGTFASSIPTALTNQAIRTSVTRTITPTTVCCPGPRISPYVGGLSSKIFLQNQVQQATLCAYTKNLAVQQLRQIPGCSVSNDVRFAKYQRFPAPTANCAPPVQYSNLPKALNGPCTNVIGISVTYP